MGTAATVMLSPVCAGGIPLYDWFIRRRGRSIHPADATPKTMTIELTTFQVGLVSLLWFLTLVIAFMVGRIYELMKKIGNDLESINESMENIKSAFPKEGLDE